MEKWNENTSSRRKQDNAKFPNSSEELIHVIFTQVMVGSR